MDRNQTYRTSDSERDFDKEYTEMFENVPQQEHTFVTKSEWNHEGDFFQEFSLYDINVPIQTSGNTTPY